MTSRVQWHHQSSVGGLCWEVLSGIELAMPLTRGYSRRPNRISEACKVQSAPALFLRQPFALIQDNGDARTIVVVFECVAHLPKPRR